MTDISPETINTIVARCSDYLELRPEDAMGLRFSMIENCRNALTAQAARITELETALKTARVKALREARDRAIAAEIRWNNIAYDNRQAGRDDNIACAWAAMAAEIVAEIAALIDKETGHD